MMRSTLCGLLLLPALLLPNVAAAEGLSLRGPVTDAHQVAVAAGSPQLSVGTWFRGGRLGLAVDWKLPRTAAWVTVATRYRLVDGERGWGVDAVLAGGAVLPLLKPGFGLQISPALLAGFTGERFRAVAGVVAPVALLVFPDLDLRLPLDLELQLGGRAGRVWILARASVGFVGAPRRAPALAGGAQLLLVIELNRPSAG